MVRKKLGTELALWIFKCAIIKKCNKVMTYKAFLGEAAKEDDLKGVAGSDCGGWA